MTRAALVLCVLGGVGAFAPPRRAAARLDVAVRAIFDEDDISLVDTLFRYGPIPTVVRVFNPDLYEQKVTELMAATGRSRLDAQRAIDFSFNDPNGFGVNEIREAEIGEKIDYSKASGVQNRPVFSALWAAWCFYFFLIFLPGRVGELGGVHPSGFTGPASLGGEAWDNIPGGPPAGF